MIRFEDATTLSLLYHLNSEPWLNVDAYQGASYEVDYKAFSNTDRTALSPPADSPLRRLLTRRKSCRRFAPRPLALRCLSDLLGNAYGISRLDDEIVDQPVPLRTVPSAGGLFPLELYLLTQGVETVPDGLHHYDVRDHALDALRPGEPFAALRPLLLIFPFIENANAVLFFAATFKRSQKKYGPRGYRYILLEAGHAAQNVCLSAAELGLGSLCMGGYRDARLNRWLGLNGTGEAVVYAVAVGQPVGETAAAPPSDP